MKNLKKVLALVLVVATVLSFATVASAASFTDNAAITNNEAVSMLADLGVINGFTDGSFKPEGTVTRAQMAKMIFAASTGDDDATGFQGTSTKLTDISGHWAEGYIKYCYSLGIIAGFTDNTFKPDDNVTVAQAAKMLLVALGYDADQYTGSAWSVNTMRDAKLAGVTDDVVAASVADASRDTAALMIFNTMFADCVNPEYQYDMGVKYVTGHKANGHTLAGDYFNLAKAEGIVKSAQNDKVTIEYNATTAEGETVVQTRTFDLPGNYDMVGKNGTVYYETNKNGTYKGLYSTEVIVDDTIVTYKTVNGDSMYKSAVDSSKKQVTLADDITVYNNGTPTAHKASDIKDTDEAKNLGYTNGKGTEVLYIDANNDGKVETIKVTNYSVLKIGSYSTITENLTVTLKAGAALTTSSWDFEDVVNYESFAKNDIVTAVEYGGILNMTKTTEVSGKVTGKVASSSSAKIDGTDYAYSAISDTTFAAQNINDEGKWYLDANGYIVSYDGDSKVSTDKLVYVMGVEAPSDLSGYQSVKLGFSDGTTAIVDVEKSDYANPGTTAKVTEKGNAVTKDTVASYTVSDNKYTLKYQGAATAATLEITKGKPQTIGGATTTTSTTFVDLANGAVYTGYGAVPTQEVSQYYVYKDGSKAALVFINSTDVKGDSDSTKFYIYKTNAYEAFLDEDDNEYRRYNAIVNGELTTVDIMANVAPTEKGLYVAESTNKNGVIDALNGSKTVLQSSITTKATYTDNEGVLTWDGKDYVLNGDTVYYLIDNSDNSAVLVDAAYLNISTVTGLYVQVVDAGASADDADSFTAAIVYIIQD